MKKTLWMAVAISFLAPAVGAAADWQYLRAPDGLQMVQVINDHKARVGVSRPPKLFVTGTMLHRATRGVHRHVERSWTRDCH